MEEPYPAITSGDGERGYATGYALRKGGSFNRKYYANGGGYTAAVCFRAAEALLNYMEASYLLNGTLDATAREYWTVLRQRAGISTDFDKTIAAGMWSGASTAGFIFLLFVAPALCGMIAWRHRHHSEISKYHCTILHAALGYLLGEAVLIGAVSLFIIGELAYMALLG